MDLGPNSGPCSGLDGPSGSCLSSGIRAGSEPGAEARLIVEIALRDAEGNELLKLTAESEARPNPHPDPN